MSSDSIQIFSTCPASNMVPGDYRTAVIRTARWSEEAGCEAMLVYSDNGLVDPWLVSQVILESTNVLCPLVAVQPVYMHPYAVAKIVTTLAALHGRRVWLNMVAGGFRNDLTALNDETPHDRRYDRVEEYATIVMALLRGERVTFEGQFYRVRGVTLSPSLPAELMPGLTVSGSSSSGAQTAKRLGAIAIEYPKRAREYLGRGEAHSFQPRGIRIGIIARPRADDAWRIANFRFPEDRRGQIKHSLAMKASDSEWHRQLSEHDSAARDDDPYWLLPFQQYQTFCPYLVGDYDSVSAELATYVKAGYQTILLDVPRDAEDLEHSRRVIEAASQRA